MAALAQQRADVVGGALPVGAVQDGAAEGALSGGLVVAAPVQPGERNQAPQTTGQIVGCACTDIRYRARFFDERVSVCMDCGQVHKVWPKVMRHG
jgi:hypothetical protein